MPLVMLGREDDEGRHFACAKRYAERRFATLPQPLWSGETWLKERIKLAYLSADFRAHPVAQLSAGLFEAHDRSRFETLGISFGGDDGSIMRRRLMTAFDQFHGEEGPIVAKSADVVNGNDAGGKGLAAMVVTTSDPVPDAVLAQIVGLDGFVDGRSVTLT